MTKQGIQRFKCKSCCKTFNALADSPLYRMKKAEKWIEYTKLMWEVCLLENQLKP
jgi:transposase-like protein